MVLAGGRLAMAVDLSVIAIVMPGTEGLEATASLQRLRPQAIIATSGNSRSSRPWPGFLTSPTRLGALRGLQTPSEWGAPLSHVARYFEVRHAQEYN